jgi:hypothetical protein
MSKNVTNERKPTVGFKVSDHEHNGFIITKAKIYMTMKLLHQTENVLSDKIW